jgi:hypothetical protein
VWDPGFRVGAGLTNENTCWDSQLSYTYFRTRARNKTRGDQIQSAYFGGDKLSDLGFFQEASIDTEIHYNVLDWGLGRRFCPTECIGLRPMIGVRGGWINQSFRTKWKKTVDLFDILVIPILAEENLRNNFWGVGPQGGVEGKWSLAGGFHVVGELIGAFLWGSWRITDQFIDSFDTRIEVLVADRDFGAVALFGFLGLGYEYACFSLKVGYEIQDWFNQYQVFDNATGGQNGDFILQGLKVQLRSDF